MKSNNTQYKNKYKNTYFSKQNKKEEQSVIMMLITTVTKPRYMRFASPCHAWLTIYRFQNRFVYSQLSKRPYHFLDLPLSNHSCCNNL